MCGVKFYTPLISATIIGPVRNGTDVLNWENIVFSYINSFAHRSSQFKETYSQRLKENLDLGVAFEIIRSPFPRGSSVCAIYVVLRLLVFKLHSSSKIILITTSSHEMNKTAQKNTNKQINISSVIWEINKSVQEIIV